jgi:hypothetical protein
VRGSGNVFRDFGDPDSELERAQAILAAKIMAVLDARQLKVRQPKSRQAMRRSSFRN